MIKLILFSAIILFSFPACYPDGPTQGIKEAQYSLVGSGEEIHFEFSYPNPGNNCQNGQLCLQQARYPEVVDSFTVAYNENKLQQFFNSQPREEIFPDLLNYPDYVSSLKDGSMKVYLDPKGSIGLYVTSNPAGKFDSTASLVFAFRSDDCQ